MDTKWYPLFFKIKYDKTILKAGGVIYNDSKIYIAANNRDFLNMLIENCSIDDSELLIETKK